MASVMSSASDYSFSSWLGASVESDFAIQGVYVNPAHFTAASSTDGSSPSSIISYLPEDQDDDLPAVQGLSLECVDSPQFLASPQSFAWSESSSSRSEAPSPFFQPEYSPSISPLSLFPENSPVPSGCSTPTPESSPSKADRSADSSLPLPPLNLDAPYYFDSALGSSPLSFPLGEMLPPPRTSRRVTCDRSSSTRRASRASPMLRSVSTPVESQRQLDDRKTNMKCVVAVMNKHAGSTGMGRNATVGGISSLATSFQATPSSVHPPSIAENASASGIGFFSAGWGSALPERDFSPAPEMVPFPYNLLNTQPATSRPARSASVTSVSYAYDAASTRHKSLPGTPRGGFPLSIVTSSPVISGRQRRTTLLTPMTPIVPISLELPPTISENARPKGPERALSY